MNRTAAFFSLVLLSSISFAESRPSLEFETSTYGQYVWRGLVLTDGPVIQTSATAGYRGVHLNIFTNTDLDSANPRRGKFSDLDYEIGYDREIETATLSGGVIRYTFPNTPIESTTELYGGARFAVPLHPSVKVFADVGAIDGAYVTFDVAHSFAMRKLRPGMPWSAEFSAGIGAASKGFNRGYFGVERAGLVDFHPAFALPIGLGSHARLTPRVGYSGAIGSGLRRSEVLKAHNFYFGLSLLFRL